MITADEAKDKALIQAHNFVESSMNEIEQKIIKNMLLGRTSCTFHCVSWKTRDKIIDCLKNQGYSVALPDAIENTEDDGCDLFIFWG